jgi:hypothetical protein
MCHEKLVNIFIEINRKRNNGKNNLTRLGNTGDSTRLDSKVFRNDSDSTRLEKWLDSPIPVRTHELLNPTGPESAFRLGLCSTESTWQLPFHRV